jgi:hypothetical protein
MKYFIGLMLLFLIFLVSCSSLTGNTVIDPNDKCASFVGGIKDDCYLQEKKCSKITSDSVRSVCVSELAILKNDPAICDLITKSSIKGNCLFTFAEKTNNLEICTSIEDKYWRDNCHFTYAITNNQDVFCAAINDAQQQDSCFLELALSQGKVSLCEMTLDTETCIFKVVQEVKDIKMCDLLPKGIPSNTCRLKLASRILEDESLCDTIKLSEMRGLCHERFL